MTTAIVMHVDDEPDIREVVRLSLRLDPDMTVASYASGGEALAAFDALKPDLVLLDVMMPAMDGPTTLANLQKARASAQVPVVFMTARVQRRELDYFKSLGAAGVLAKPFDPGTLAKELRGFLRPDVRDMDVMKVEFLDRARRDADKLAGCRTAMSAGRREDARISARELAHGLAGAGGIFGYGLISDEAMALEETLIADATDIQVESAIDTLLARIAATLGAAADATG